MDWSELFPDHSGGGRRVEFVDVGCGYGGLLISLAPLFPDTLMLGMEIRIKVCDYVRDRVAALRHEHAGEYGNVACLRSNAMKYLPNLFYKAQLSKLFFLYPDPHFKRAKHKWRIVSPSLLAEYAFVLRPGGLVYTMTDVEDLHVWIVKCFRRHPLFQMLSAEELQDDAVVPLLSDNTEEGQKVTRNNGRKFPAVFRRIDYD